MDPDVNGENGKGKGRGKPLKLPEKEQGDGADTSQKDSVTMFRIGES